MASWRLSRALGYSGDRWGTFYPVGFLSETWRGICSLWNAPLYGYRGVKRGCLLAVPAARHPLFRRFPPRTKASFSILHVFSILTILFIRWNVVVIKEIVCDFTEGFCCGYCPPFACTWAVVFYTDYKFWIVYWAVSTEGSDCCSGSL